ncbi:DUF2391 domain-containing protein [Halobellus limi]|uniref:DUF2391 family protein n=1 Tax=Halobellus limi TaxID=699433 RepID=A0A1H5YDK0_9EURY|nr:DUF2391 domain-containing protein [Halobellus limi]SEG21697.1 hypothetical protein SAMN04488133_1535 [Halobellus limi]
MSDDDQSRGSGSPRSDQPPDSGPPRSDRASRAARDLEDDSEDGEYEVDSADEELQHLLEEFDALAETVDSPAERARVRRARRAAVIATTAAAEAADAPVFGRVIRGFDRSDLAEAFLGSFLFGVPMFVEGGTNEVGAFLARRPLFLFGTVLSAIGLVVGILYVAEIQDVRVHNPILGVVPRRLVGVLGVSFLTAVAAMTAWGRIAWSEPTLAFATVAVAFVPMSVGAALGDILPGT